MRKFSQCFRDYFAQNDPWRLRLCFKLGLGHTCTILLARYIICVTLLNIICQTVIPHAATRLCCGKETTLRHAFFAWPETIIKRMHVFNSWCYGNEIIDATTWKSLPGTIWCPEQCKQVTGMKQCTWHWFISSEPVKKQGVFNSLIIQHLIIITFISYENKFAISVPKCINIAPF